MMQNVNVNDIKIVQEKLKQLGYYHAIPTGIYNLATEEGIEAFQRENQQEVTGVLDNQTLDLLYYLTEPDYIPISTRPTLKLGDSGQDVLELQKKLKALLYYQGPLTSSFDIETENAVKRFQMLNDITASGVVNSTTWNKIDGLYGNISDCAKEEENTSDSYITYKVEKGDTLYAIARRYGTTVEAIKKLNGLTSDMLSIGQTLKIPTESTDTTYITYQVEKGDTLYAIARRYGTTVEAIKKLNGLTSDMLSIGQTLKIPTESTDTTYITYQVEKGDTLYALARRYGTTVEAIKQLNGLTTNLLSIGQILRIPVVS